MIRKYIDALFGRRKQVTHKDARPVVHGPDKHSIRRESISKCARRTCEELQRAGYLALRRIADFFRIEYNPNATRDDLISISRLEFDSVCGQMGVSVSTSESGLTTAPPAASE